MKNTRAAEQIFRVDGKNVFLEITTHGLPIDKVFFGFVEYNKSAQQGQRISGSIGIYMNILEAQVLSRDIMSGRIAQLGMLSRKKAEEEGSKYPQSVFMKQGGTCAKNNNGQAIARQFEITPGASKPWILVAKQGKAHETPQGLIVMDSADCTIRIPLTNDKLKEFALAIEAAVQTWIQLRFVRAAAPAMELAAEKREADINKQKALSAARAQENRTQ